MPLGRESRAGIPARLRAVLMDLDGTLYRQRPVRKRMAVELGLLPLHSSPLNAMATWRRISCFRKVREELRALGRPEASLEDLQYSAPAHVLHCEPTAVRDTVDEWMTRRPLRHLGASARKDLGGFLEFLKERGISAGVFSDYPPQEKLEAMGFGDAFSLALCATDPEINAFKPHPRGFQYACSLWGFDPADVLYVGDRHDVDATGARAAGMPCVILGDPDLEGDPMTFATLTDLLHALQRRS